MRISTGAALQALESLQKLSGVPFPAREAYVLAKITAKLRSHADVIAIEAARKACAKKYGTEDAGGMISVSGEKLNRFVEEYSPLASQAIEIDLPILPLAIFDSAPDMTPQEIEALGPLLPTE